VPQPAGAPAQSEQPHKVDQMDARAIPPVGSPADGSVEALRRKAEAYSSQMATLIQARSAPPKSAAPSAVQWMDQPKPPDEVPSVTQAVIDTSPAISNVGTVAETQPKANMPQTVAIATPMPRVLTPRPAAPMTSDALAEKLARRVKDDPRDVSAQLEYQMLKFLFDEPTPQLSTLSSLPTEDRELVTAVLDGLTNLRNALRADQNMLLSKKIKPILDLSERLRSQADLTIPTIALCSRVNGFGSYDPIEPARFAAGRDHPVIVYCEVANFTSNLNDQQMWETRLTWDMTLYTEQGMSVWSDKTETIGDTSRNRRHDFFVRKMITLPSTLTIGRYLLKCSIVDTQSNRVSEATIPIVIAAQ
jgi:hypothetical protein